MTVTIRVIRKGRLVEEKIFPRKSMERVLDYFEEKNIALDMTVDFEELVKRSGEGAAFICFDASDAETLDDIPPFEAKYTVDYEEKTEHELYRLLSD